MAETTPEQRTQRLLKLGELERSLALVAKLTEGRPEFRDPMAKIERQFVALSREIRRFVARDAARDNAYARHSAATVTEAEAEIRAAAASTPVTTVSAGLRRLAEAPELLPRGGSVREQTCTDCGHGFSSQLGRRRCRGCTERHDRRRQADLERARTRLSPTRLSEGWAEVAEEEAHVMRRVFLRGDR